MRVSRSGLVVAVVYLVAAIGCGVWGYSLTGPKESTVLMQLPIVPVLILVDVLGLHEAAANAPLLVFYGLAISAVAVALYAACWLFGALGSRVRLAIGVTVLGMLGVGLFWPLRR